MSRQHILKTKYNMTYEDLRRLYHRLGTIKAVMAELGVARRTVINWMREGGITGIDHRTHRVVKKTALFQWIEEHPHCRLPTSLAGIVDQTGLPKSLVKQALARRAKGMRKSLMALPLLMNQPGSLIASDGRRLPLAAIASYDLRLNWFTLDVTVIGDLRSGEYFEAKMSKAEYRQLCSQPITPVAPKQHPFSQERR